MFTVDANYQIQQPLAQFFVSQLINHEWVQPGGGEHRTFAASSDVEDGGGHALVTAYAVSRPDGQWSVMLVNRDQENAHRLRVEFSDGHNAAGSFVGPLDISTFGSGQYKWHPASTRFMAHAEHAAEHTVVMETQGHADPDGPIVRSKANAGKDTLYDVPAASVVVLRGKISRP
jgi:hypothetical protein